MLNMFLKRYVPTSAFYFSSQCMQKIFMHLILPDLLLITLQCCLQVFPSVYYTGWRHRYQSIYSRFPTHLWHLILLTCSIHCYRFIVLFLRVFWGAGDEIRGLSFESYVECIMIDVTMLFHYKNFWCNCWIFYICISSLYFVKTQECFPNCYAGS